MTSFYSLVPFYFFGSSPMPDISTEATHQIHHAAIPPDVVSAGAEAPVSRRDQEIDILRGWCIVMMIASHMGGGPIFGNIMHIQRYIGGAEGFVTFSGLVLGMLAARQRTPERRTALNVKILRRSGQIACLHYLLIVTILFIHQTTGRIGFVPFINRLGSWPQAAGLIISLRFQPKYLDILPLYVFFLLGAPALIGLLRRGYGSVCLAVSSALYLWAQFSPTFLRYVDMRFSDEPFRIAAWQLLFVIGICVGYHRLRITKEVWPAWRGVIITACIVCYVSVFLMGVASRFHLFGLYHDSPLDIALFSKSSLSFGRMLAFFSANLLAYLTIRFFRRRGVLMRSLEWLRTLGTYSLYCFIVHFGLLIFEYAIGANAWTALLRDAIVVFTVFIVYGMAKYRILMNVIPN